MGKLFANSGDPDQMPHSVASDLGLLSLPITLWVSRLKWVNTSTTIAADDILFILFHFSENRLGISCKLSAKNILECCLLLL